MIKTDYWMMNADGSDPHRLTYFNQPGVPEYRLSENIASDLSWSPDGKSIVAYLQLRCKGDRIDNFPGFHSADHPSLRRAGRAVPENSVPPKDLPPAPR